MSLQLAQTVYNTFVSMSKCEISSITFITVNVYLVSALKKRLTALLYVPYSMHKAKLVFICCLSLFVQ